MKAKRYIEIESFCADVEYRCNELRNESANANFRATLNGVVLSTETLLDWLDNATCKESLPSMSGLRKRLRKARTLLDATRGEID